MCILFFFFNDTATTEIYTLSLHDALPICTQVNQVNLAAGHKNGGWCRSTLFFIFHGLDRKSTRLNSSHANISYAVFCLKKKKNNPFLFSFLHHFYYTFYFFPNVLFISLPF